MTEMKFVKERINNRMEGWMSSTMSIGSRVTKIVASLTNSVVYQMPMRLLRKTNIKGMEKTNQGVFVGWQ
jgi:hypothetical protein